MVKYILIFSLLLLGCGFNKPKKETVYVEVKVPVAVCPKPQDFEKPVLPIHSLTKQSAPNEIVEAYRNSVDILMTEIVKRDLVLDDYRNFKSEEK